MKWFFALSVVTCGAVAVDEPSLNTVEYVSNDMLSSVAGGAPHYCTWPTPGGQSNCATCIQDESGDWVRCSSSNSQLTACGMPYSGPAPSPYCEDWTYNCGGDLYVYTSQVACVANHPGNRTVIVGGCGRTYLDMKTFLPAIPVNCQ